MKTQESASRLLNDIQAMKGEMKEAWSSIREKEAGTGRRCEGTQEKCFNV